MSLPDLRFSHRLTVLVLTSLYIPFALAQEVSPRAPGCPTGALTLDQVLGLIRNKAPDDKVGELVGSCHVGFTMDPAAVERLSAAGPAPSVLDAIDRDTISRMQLSQARNEVAALESGKQANETSANAERDAALRKLDADYKVQRETSAQIRPRGEFEPAVDYNNRVRKATDDLAAMDRNHGVEQTRLREKYAADLRQKNQPLDRRIAALKRGLFPVIGAPPAWISYNPDIPRLVATVSGQEYWFPADPRSAQALKEHWSSVKVLEPYGDTDSDARFLAALPNVEPVAGSSRSKIEKAEIERLLENAQKYYAAGNYDRARSEYERVKTLDPNNLPAQDGIAKARLAIGQKEADEAVAEAEVVAAQQRLQELKENPRLIPGTWYDAVTQLLWTDKDNGKGVNVVEASNWCRQVSISGTSGWRLPTINELNGIYDSTQSTHNESKTTALLQGGVITYHVKGNIHLTDLMTEWSSATSEGGLAAVAKDFVLGKNEPRSVRSNLPRALCVGVVQLSALPLPPQISNLVPAGTAGTTPVLEGEWRGVVSLPGRNLPLILQIAADGGGKLTSPSQNFTAPFQYSLNGNRIAITSTSKKLAGGHASYAGTVNGGKMTGTWSQVNTNWPLTLTRTGASPP